YAYRAANTLDSMVGYRGAHEWTGKLPARLDDALNLLPARVAALLLTAVAGRLRGDTRGAWRTARRDHALTASPNAGWTMSAAGARDGRLEKLGAYGLNDEGRAPDWADVARCRRLVLVAGIAAAALTAGLAGGRPWR